MGSEMCIRDSPITGKFIFFFISFKFLNPSILKALAPPIIEAFAEAKTKEGVSKGPCGIGWHEAINEFLNEFIIILFFLYINN